MNTWARYSVRLIAALIFLAAGIGHFLARDTLARFIPPYLPAAGALVLISGAFEIAGGIGLLVDRFRRWAAWGLSAMLVSFLPANLFMALNPADAGLPEVPEAIFWLRIAVLPLMVWCLFWCTRGNPATRAGFRNHG